METKRDRFGFTRGPCGAGSCTCQGFIPLKATHECKTCLHAPKHHRVQNNQQQNSSLHKQDNKTDTSSSHTRQLKTKDNRKKTVAVVEVHYQNESGKKTFIKGLCAEYITPAEVTTSSLFEACLGKTGWLSGGRMLTKKDGLEIFPCQDPLPKRMYFRKCSEAKETAELPSKSKRLNPVRQQTATNGDSVQKSACPSEGIPSLTHSSQNRLVSVSCRTQAGLSSKRRHADNQAEEVSDNGDPYKDNPLGMPHKELIRRKLAKQARRDSGEGEDGLSKDRKIEALENELDELNRQLVDKRATDRDMQRGKQYEKLLVLPTEDVKVHQTCLGSGVSAKVYSGSYSNMDVAIKIFSEPAKLEDYADDSEVQMLLRLSHPCIVSLYGLVQLRDYVGVVSEKADMDLSAYIQHKATRLSDGIKKDFLTKQNIARDVVGAIQFQDIKPLNILLFGTRAKLADLGLACFNASSMTLTAGRHSGTPYYMAPELQLTSRGKPSKASDVWSLGLTLLELFNDSRAWTSGTVKLPDQHFRVYKELRDRQQPTTIRLLPVGVRNTIEKILVYEAVRRPTAKEIMSDLSHPAINS